jgi:hypothetical protein
VVTLSTFLCLWLAYCTACSPPLVVFTTTSTGEKCAMCTVQPSTCLLLYITHFSLTHSLHLPCLFLYHAASPHSSALLFYVTCILSVERMIQIVSCDRPNHVIPVVIHFDRLCGLVVRVSGYRYRGPGATRFSE